MEALLNAGTDVDAENKGGRTALVAATLNGHGAVIKALLRNGATQVTGHDRQPSQAATVASLPAMAPSHGSRGGAAIPEK